MLGLCRCVVGRLFDDNKISSLFAGFCTIFVIVEQFFKFYVLVALFCICFFTIILHSLLYSHEFGTK